MLIRDDYRELLLLAENFLGGDLTDKVQFFEHGAVHHARWMAKAIYFLKIYLFRKVFNWSLKEEKALIDICLFIVFVYIKPWFTVPFAFQAPNNDLTFIKNLFNYERVDSAIGKCALKKIENH